MDGMEPADLLNDDEICDLGRTRTMWTSWPQFEEMGFHQVWQNHLVIEVEGIAVPFISKADLIANKRQVGRLRDLADVEVLLLLPD